MELKDLLIKAGVDEALVAKITETAEAEKLNLIIDNKEKPNYLPKSRFDEVNTKKGELERQIQEIKNSTTDNSELQTKLTEMEKNYNSQLKKLKVESIVADKFNDASDIHKFVDMEKISLDNDNLIGLQEQLDILTKSKPYLLKQAQETIIQGTQNSAATNISTNTNMSKKFTRAEIEAMTADEVNKNWDAIKDSGAL